MLEQVERNVLRWMQRCWSSAAASLYTDGRPSLLPTCFAVLAAECLETLDAVPEKHRCDTADFIQSHQSDEDGLFSPGNFKRSELSSHSATYLRMQATYFALHALDALGRRPGAPRELVERFCDTRYLRGWLDGGPWHNPWMHSNNIMFALTFLQCHFEDTGELAAMDAFDAILEYLNERQDPATGLWQPDDGVDLPNAVYAAYHFFPYYFWRGVLPDHVERIIESTLAVQKADGLFAPRGGGACEDLDGVHTLVMMSLVTSYRSGDVRQALERCFWRLLQIQNPDGGFANYSWRPPRKGWKRRFAESIKLDRIFAKRLRQPAWRRPPTWRYSGWQQLECPKGESDMWAAWFRPLALRLIAERYPELTGARLPGRYRRLPGLGWHDPAAIAEARPQNPVSVHSAPQRSMALSASTS